MILKWSRITVYSVLICISVLVVLETAGELGDYQYYRLPTAIKPILYNLNIITYLEPNNLKFRGFVTILLNVVENTNNITLHVGNITVDRNRILLKKRDDFHFEKCVLSVKTVPFHDYFIIETCRPLERGKLYYVKLFFKGLLSDQLRGYYRSSYTIKETKEKRWLSMTQFEPVSARAAFPCFDEPIYKARFQIRLGHHRSRVALSNMPVVTKYSMIGENEYIWSIFKESVPMSTYLVAFSINDFAYKSTNLHKKVLFRTWSRPEAIEQTKYANIIGPLLLKYYENTFGLQFPLSKMDQIAVPDFAAGAMENWGLIAYRETALLYTPNISSEANKQHIANIIAHELAHQWFGNLVTMKWWSDLWLNEGFATYIASLGVHNLYPEWDALNEESLNNLLLIFRRDAQMSTHPVSQSIENTYHITDRFDTISYKKGSAILRMLHNMLGSKAFFDSIRNYLHEKQYSNAEQDDLWRAFTTQAHIYRRIDPNTNMKTIMDSWTLQEGFPLVHVQRNYTNGLTVITQTRFVENVTTVEFKEMDKCWWIPLTYTTSSMLLRSPQKSKTVWLKCTEGGLPEMLPISTVIEVNNWFLMNVEFTGVFRVMYDDHNLELLINTLNSPKYEDIPVMNRAQLIDDNAWLSWFGYQNYEQLFNLLEYMTQETAYLPWRASLEGLMNVNRLLRRFDETYKNFKIFMLRLLTPIYYTLNGLNDTTIRSHTYVQHKSLIASWACRLEMQDCVETALFYFKEWRAESHPDNNNAIPVDLRMTVYCTAIRHGNQDDWDFLWQRYQESVVSAERQAIIFALSCSVDTVILKKYLRIVFDPKEALSMEESRHAFSSIARSTQGYPLALNYFIKNIDKLNTFYKSNVKDLAALLQALSSQVIRRTDLRKLQDILRRKSRYFQNIDKTILSAFETIYFNIDWVRRNVNRMHGQLDRRSIRYQR